MQFMNTISRKLMKLSESPIARLTWNVMKMMHVSERITAWPPMILANRRTIRANGLLITPIISMIGISGTGHFKNNGTLGQNTSFQYSRLPNKLTAKNVQQAKNSVMLMFPVTLAPPGKNGIRPSTLTVKMKRTTLGCRAHTDDSVSFRCWESRCPPPPY